MEHLQSVTPLLMNLRPILTMGPPALHPVQPVQDPGLDPRPPRWWRSENTPSYIVPHILLLRRQLQSGLDKILDLATGGRRKKFSLAESFEYINYWSSRNLKKESLFLQIFGRLIIYLVKTFCRLEYLIICCQHRKHREQWGIIGKGGGGISLRDAIFVITIKIRR